MPKQPRRKRQGSPSTNRASRAPQTPKAEPRDVTATPADSVFPGTSASTTSRATTSRASARREERRFQRQNQDQRKKYLYIGGAVLAVAVVVAVFFGVSRWMLGPDVSEDVVTHFEQDVAAAIHPEDDTVILYEQVPPVGGPHNAIWQTCGFYDEYIFNWHGVHALEHGAVWLTYDPELPQEDIDALADKANQGYVLVSPYPGLDAPVVGSVWGKQMTFDGVDDDRIDAFIQQYRLNPDNTLEPGARCTGGVTLTTDQVPQQNAYQQADPNADPIGGLTSIDATATAAAPAPESTPVASPEARNEVEEAAAS